MNRRGFLKLAGSGLAVAAAPAVVLVEPEPVRRYWQVGADLSRGRSETEWPGLHPAVREQYGYPEPVRHRLGWQQYGYPDDGPHDDMADALRYSRPDAPDYIPPRGVQWQLLGVDEASAEGLFGIEASERGPWVGDSDVQTILHRIGSIQLRRVWESES